jgi:hypothetical protein
MREDIDAPNRVAKETHTHHQRRPETEREREKAACYKELLQNEENLMPQVALNSSITAYFKAEKSMAVVAVRPGIVSRTFPETGKSTGKFSTSTVIPGPEIALLHCFCGHFY